MKRWLTKITVSAIVTADTEEEAMYKLAILEPTSRDIEFKGTKCGSLLIPLKENEDGEEVRD